MYMGDRKGKHRKWVKMENGGEEEKGGHGAMTLSLPPQAPPLERWDKSMMDCRL